MVFSDERARREIGYSSRPARQAIQDSARWFIDNGYVAASRKALINPDLSSNGNHPPG
jgi:hypothetical protein